MESRTQGSRPRPRPRTQKNFEAKDRPFRGQGQGHRRKCFPKKRSSKIFFRRKRSPKIFFSRSLLEETKKRSLQIFCEVSGVIQQNFNGSKIVLSSSCGQGNFRGLEASRPRPRTSKCSRPWTSSRTPPLIRIHSESEKITNIFVVYTAHCAPYNFECIYWFDFLTAHQNIRHDHKPETAKLYKLQV